MISGFGSGPSLAASVFGGGAGGDRGAGFVNSAFVSTVRGNAVTCASACTGKDWRFLVREAISSLCFSTCLGKPSTVATRRSMAANGTGRSRARSTGTPVASPYRRAALRRLERVESSWAGVEAPTSLMHSSDICSRRSVPGSLSVCSTSCAKHHGQRKSPPACATWKQEECAKLLQALQNISKTSVQPQSPLTHLMTDCKRCSP